MPPTPPFTDEVTAWNILIESFTASIDWHPAPVETGIQF
jgi:hypothetical protein